MYRYILYTYDRWQNDIHVFTSSINLAGVRNRIGRAAWCIAYNATYMYHTRGQAYTHKQNKMSTFITVFGHVESRFATEQTQMNKHLQKVNEVYSG